jgi:hypothetical protein
LVSLAAAAAAAAAVAMSRGFTMAQIHKSRRMRIAHGLSGGASFGLDKFSNRVPVRQGELLTKPLRGKRRVTDSFSCRFRFRVFAFVFDARANCSSWLLKPGTASLY